MMVFEGMDENSGGALESDGGTGGIEVRLVFAALRANGGDCPSGRFRLEDIAAADGANDLQGANGKGRAAVFANRLSTGRFANDARRRVDEIEDRGANAMVQELEAMAGQAR